MSVHSAVGTNVAFRCNWTRETEPARHPELEVVRVACIGRIPAGLIMQAIERGAGQVLVLGCPENECRHQNGVRLAQAQVRIVRDLLHLLGLDPDRVRLVAEDDSLMPRSAAHPGA
jgi:coenzyme F420-reducing hydrogenase delta subunit